MFRIGYVKKKCCYAEELHSVDLNNFIYISNYIVLPFILLKLKWSTVKESTVIT